MVEHSQSYPETPSDFYNLSGPDLLAYCGADASKWSTAFCAIKEAQGWSAADIDEGLMNAWFANAIEHSSQVRGVAQAPTYPEGESALLPCPFCGATPHRGLTKPLHDQMHGETLHHYRIWCPHDCASKRAINEDQAIAAWNTRTGGLAQAAWQPIETAPKDTDVLLGWRAYMRNGQWMQKVGYAHCTKGGWLDGNATHWMPLPDGPPLPSTNHQSLDQLLDGMTDENRYEELPVSPLSSPEGE